MAVKTFHFLNTTGTTPNFSGSMQADGTAPSAVVSTAGWQVGKTAVTTPFYRGRWGATAKATAAQASPGYIAGTSGPAEGTGTGITTAGDSFITPAAYSGTFASGAWTVTLAARPTTITAVGRMRMRVWACATSEGGSPRELTAGALVGSIVTMSSTTTTYTSAITWSPAAITLNNEYIFFQIEWEETTAGTSNSTALGLYIGTARIVTTNFINKYVLPADTNTPAFAITDVGTPAILRQGCRVIAAKGNFSITGNDTGLPIVTPWTPSGVDLTYTQLMENATTGPHYVTRPYTFIVGDSYQFSIDYKPNGPNPRGIYLIVNLPYGPNGSSFSITGSNTGIETSSSVTAGYWTLDQHSITGTANSYYKALVRGTYIEPNQVSRDGDLQIYLYSTSNSYTGDGNSGFAFQNYKALHYSKFIADQGSYGLTGYDVTFEKTAALPKVLNADAGSYSYVTIASDLNNLISCTRASIGYSETSDGRLIQFPANTLRITDLGLLVEDARTNIIVPSQDISSWTKTGVTVTADAVVAPDGTLTADAVSDNPTNSTHSVSRSIGVSNGTAYTCSVYAKAGTGSWLQLHVVSGSSFYANFDLANGVIGLNSGTIAIKMDPLANGWYRCSITFTVGSTTATCYLFQLLTNTTSTGYIGTNSIWYLWGSQLEQGSFISSYIPTTTVSATRAADVTTTTGSLDSLLTANVCSVVLDMKAPGTVDLENKNGGSHWIQSATGQMIVGTDYNFQNTKPNSRWQGMLVGNTYGNSQTLAGGVKVGVSWDAVADTLSLVGGGSAVGTMSMPGAVPLATPVYIGRGLYTATHYFGYFRRLTVWSSRLSDTTLQNLTEPANVVSSYTTDLDFTNARYLSGPPSEIQLVYTANPNKILPADYGAYTYTGRVADLDYGYRVIAANGVYGITGQAQTLRFNHRSLEANGIYGITGQAQTLRFNHRSLEANGIYGLAGRNVDLDYGHKFAAANSVYGITGQTQILRFNHRSLEANGIYGLAGQAATFKFNHRSFEANGIYGITGQVATFKLRYQIAAANGAYNYSGQDASFIFLAAVKGLNAVNGVYSIAGQAVIPRAIRKLALANTVYSYIGNVAGLRIGRQVYAANGAYTRIGQVVTLTAKRSIALANGNYSIAGQVTTFKAIRKLALANTIYTYTGNASTLRFGHKFAAANTAYSITGQVATFIPVRRLIAANTSYAISGKVATFKLRYQIAATKGTYTFTGQDAAVTTKGRFDGTNFTITGSPAILRRSRLFPCANTSYASTGRPATLKLGRRVIAANTVYAISGKDISYKLRYQTVAAKGTHTYTGQVTTLKLGRTLVAANSSYALAGKNNNFKIRYQLGITQASYQLIGGDTRLTQRVEYEIAANRGTYNLSGKIANFISTRSIICDAGTYDIAANDVEKIHIHIDYCISGLYGFDGQAASLSSKTGSFTEYYGIVGSPVTFVRTYRHVSGGIIETKPKNSLSGSLLVIPDTETGVQVVNKPRDSKSGKMYELVDKITAVKTF